MAGIIDLSGTLIAGPQTVVDSTFPSMQSTVGLHTSPSPKGWNVCTGVLSRNINSPSAYVALEGVGATATVVNADFLYLRSNGTLKLRITQTDGLGTLLSEQYFSGLKVIELPSTNCAVLVEVKGTATIEYLASGQS